MVLKDAHPVTARAALRAATADDHRRVDDIFSRFPLAERDGYRRFLTATAAAFLPAEARLEQAGVARFVRDWPERRRSAQLRRDLDALGDAQPGSVPPLADAAMDEPEMLGTLYVLEGSRLGGALLKRSVPADLPQSFLETASVQGAWRRLAQLLDERLNDPDRLARAIAAARATFASFAAAGEKVLEPAHG